MSARNFTGPAEDLAAIRALCERYCLGVIKFDTAMLGETWDEAGAWVRPDQTVTGRSAIAAAAAQILALYESADFVCHLNDTHVEGDRAWGRCYHSEVFGKGGAIEFYLSHYDDAYVRTGEGWKFAERRFTLLERRRFRPAD